MTDRTPPAPSPRPTIRIGVALVLGVLALPTLGPRAASAEDGPFGDPGPRRVRQHRPERPLAVPGPPAAAIVTGYLPRNHGVPMYNEPPGTRSFGGPAW